MTAFLTARERVWCVRCKGWKFMDGEDDPCPDGTPEGECPIQEGDTAKQRPVTIEDAQEAIDVLAKEAQQNDDVGYNRIGGLEEAINVACEIIETGDQRLLAGDGPAGGQPPELSLDEWRKLYVVLDATRSH